MDWRSFADHFNTMTCVLSVEKKPDGTCGTIRIVTGNQKYLDLDSLELAGGSVEVGNEKKVEFVPESEYTRYIPKDLNFEDVCFAAGSCLLKPGMDLRDALSEADAQMYRDKGNFYRKYPELKRD